MNTIINFVTTYYPEIILVIVAVITVSVAIKDFIYLPNGKKVEQIKGWLLGAVTLAEAEFGSGTGKIKLSVVYDAFVERFPWLAKIISFTKFGKFVDDALVDMRNLLETNKDVANIVEDK